MTAAVAIAAVLAAASVALALPSADLGPTSPAKIAGPGTAHDPGPISGGGQPDGRRTRWRVVGTGLLAGGAVGVLVGGPLGVAGGCCVALAVPAAVARMEPAHARWERRELLRAAPLVADLLCASLQAGVPVELAVPVVAHAVGGPAGRLLSTAHRMTELGQPMDSVWAGLVRAPGLGGVARAVVRSSRTGAPMAEVLSQAATDLREEAAAGVLERVRSTSVRAVLPLGLCLLPSFVLLGVVPVVGGLLPSL